MHLRTYTLKISATGDVIPASVSVDADFLRVTFASAAFGLSFDGGTPIRCASGQSFRFGGIVRRIEIVPDPVNGLGGFDLKVEIAAGSGAVLDDPRVKPSDDAFFRSPGVDAVWSEQKEYFSDSDWLPFSTSAPSWMIPIKCLIRNIGTVDLRAQGGSLPMSGATTPLQASNVGLLLEPGESVEIPLGGPYPNIMLRGPTGGKYIATWFGFLRPS